jgi:hypothetical protein
MWRRCLIYGFFNCIPVNRIPVNRIAVNRIAVNRIARFGGWSL